MSYYWTEHITDLQVGGEEASWNQVAQERQWEFYQYSGEPSGSV